MKHSSYKFPVRFKRGHRFVLSGTRCGLGQKRGRGGDGRRPAWGRFFPVTADMLRGEYGGRNIQMGERGEEKTNSVRCEKRTRGIEKCESEWGNSLVAQPAKESRRGA